MARYSGAAGESLQYVENVIVDQAGVDGLLFDGIARASVVEYAQVHAAKVFEIAGRRVRLPASPLLMMLGLQLGVVEIRRRSAVEDFESRGPRPGQRGN